MLFYVYYVKLVIFDANDQTFRQLQYAQVQFILKAHKFHLKNRKTYKMLKFQFHSQNIKTRISFENLIIEIFIPKSRIRY